MPACASLSRLCLPRRQAGWFPFRPELEPQNPAAEANQEDGEAELRQDIQEMVPPPRISVPPIRGLVHPEGVDARLSSSISFFRFIELNSLLAHPN